MSAPTASARYAPDPSTPYDPARTESPTPRATGSASPVRIDSSSPSPSLRSTRPSATTWSPASSSTRSPGTTCGTATWRGLPSRTTVARGATRAARRSRLLFARASCTIPMPALRIRIPRKIASRGSAKIRVMTPKITRTTLKTVSRLARRMLGHERLVGGPSYLPSLGQPARGLGL